MHLLKDNQSAGFTLIELMSAMAIFSILAVIAIPNCISWYASSKLNSATRSLMSDLSMARMHAITANEVVKVLFFIDGYTAFIDENDDDVIDAGEEILRERNYPAGVSMSANTFPSDKMIFDRTGIVNPPGSGGEIVLDQGSGTRMRVLVNLTGRIQVETV